MWWGVRECTCVGTGLLLPKIIFQVIWGNWGTTFKKALPNPFLHGSH